MNLRHSAAAMAALFLCATLPALADPIVTTAGITLNFLDGSHQINGGTTAKLNFVPLPLGEITVRHRDDSIRLEGLPPVAFSYQGGGLIGLQTTRLSIVNATYRRSFAGGWFVGIGQTLYNQHTTYASVNNAIYQRFTINQIFPIVGSEEQYSRVTGARYEVGREWHVGTSGTRIEASVAYNPAMHGVQYTFIPTGTAFNPTFADPENASQLDIAVRASHPFGRGELVYGVRYLHYISRYVDDPGQLADRNVGIAPVLGYRVRL